MFQSVVINDKKVSTFINDLHLRLKGSLPGKWTYLPDYDMSFYFLNSIFCRAAILSLDVVQFIQKNVMDHAFDIIFKKSLLKVTKFRIPAFHVD